LIKLILIGILLSFNLIAEEHYPKFYASMGDVLYDDAKGFEFLMQSEHFKKEYIDIHVYLLLSSETEKLGHKIDDKSTSLERIEYVKALRLLNLQNGEICIKISRRLELLFKQSQYDFLSSLRENSALCIQKSNIIQRATELTLELPSSSDNIASFSNVQTIFNEYKKQLLQARENESASECLNNLTALYHYFIEIEIAQENYNCKDFDAAYEQMNGYYHAVELSCIKEDDLNKAGLIHRSYVTKRCP